MADSSAILNNTGNATFISNQKKVRMAFFVGLGGGLIFAHFRKSNALGYICWAIAFSLGTMYVAEKVFNATPFTPESM
jgi:hypothetical protein